MEVWIHNNWRMKMIRCKLFRGAGSNLEADVNKWLQETSSMKEIISMTQSAVGGVGGYSEHTTITILYKSA